MTHLVSGYMIEKQEEGSNTWVLGGGGGEGLDTVSITSHMTPSCFGCRDREAGGRVQHVGVGGGG